MIAWKGSLVAARGLEPEPEPEPPAGLHSPSPRYELAACEKNLLSDVGTPKADVQPPTPAEAKLILAITALETELDATNRSHEVAICAAARSHQNAVDAATSAHQQALASHQEVAETTAASAAAAAAAAAATLAAQRRCTEEVQAKLCVSEGMLAELREQHRHDLQAARESTVEARYQYAQREEDQTNELGQLKAAHANELARLQAALDTASSQLAKARAQSIFHQEMEEIYQMKKERSQATDTVVVSATTNLAEINSKVVHDAAVQTEDEPAAVVQVRSHAESEPLSMLASAEAVRIERSMAIEATVRQAVTAADMRHDAVVQALRCDHATELAMWQTKLQEALNGADAQAQAQNQLATDHAAVLKQMQERHAAELARMKQTARSLGDVARAAHQLLRCNLADIALAQCNLRQEFTSASSSLQQHVAAAIAVHGKCAEEEQSEQAEREQALRAEISSLTIEMQQLQQRADGASEALHAVLRQERAVNADLRRELEAAQLQVRTAASPVAAAVGQLNDHLQLSTEKLLQQHVRSREFRSMLDVFRRWLFLSDVRVALQQQKAEQDRAVREDAQARELNALRRELRAVVTAAVASDMQRMEAQRATDME